MPFPCAGNCGAQLFNFNETCTNCKAAAMKGGLKKSVVPPQATAPTLAPGALPPNAVLGVKYRGKGQLAWADVGNNDTLYVLKDTEVEFKVDSTGGALALRAMIRYETARWAGTVAGAASTGATKSLRLSANSAAAATPSTLTAAFGGQTHTVNLIVYTLNVVSTPADNFAGRSQTELGVDERVSLGFTTTPIGVTAVNAGGLLWRIAKGVLATRDATGILQNATTHTGAPANDGLADYIAPFRTHVAGGLIQSSKEVAVQLSVVAGPSIGRGPEQNYRVHKPAAHMTQVPASAIQHFNTGGNAYPSAGFAGQIFFAPKLVSFRTLRWREGTGTMESSGTCAGSEGGDIHATTVHVNATHGTLGGGSVATGCYVEQQDNVRSAGSLAGIVSSGSRTTKVGQKKWPITWEYTYAALDPANPNGGTGWTTDWIAMQIAHHTGTQFENGRFEIFKGHVGCSDCMQAVSRDLADPHFWL